MMPKDVSEEDKALFRKMMEDVKPLNQKAKVSYKTVPTPRQPYSREQEKTAIPSYNLSDAYPNTVHADSILSYHQASLPFRRFRQLKLGQIPWEARLDLHGLSLSEAKSQLCQFIEQQIQLGHRSLLIIHGKGSRQGESPILKNHVNHWLRQFPQVLAFHSTLPRDGGSGSLYVLIKRARI